eukprot:5965255-Pyramimonas_sp.AAC.2
MYLPSSPGAWRHAGAAPAAASARSTANYFRAPPPPAGATNPAPPSGTAAPAPANPSSPPGGGAPRPLRTAQARALRLCKVLSLCNAPVPPLSAYRVTLVSRTVAATSLPLRAWSASP